MAKKFSISEGMLSGISKNTEKVATLESKENFKFEYIDIDDIRKNKKNFYEISDINELVEDISINGLNHNLVVRPIENGLYELISGERRYTALKELVSRGEEKFKKVPCKVSDLNDLDSEIVLIQANAQSRELSDADKLKQVERLTELYNIKKSSGQRVGKIRERISKDTGLSETQVGRYTTINKGLIPELKETLEQGNLSIANASEFATLSEDNQRVILDIMNSKVSINKNEANNLKNKLKKIEKDKDDLLKKEEEYISEIKKLSDANEKATKELDIKIEKVKLELSEKSTSERKSQEQKLKDLEKEKLVLEKENDKLINKLNEKNNNGNIEKIAIEKAKEIASNFEKDKKKIEKENVKLKNELNEIKKDEENIAIHQELKIRLKSVRKDMGRVAGLMANNTIIDETLMKEIDNLKMELKFLNEQIDLYTNQEKLV
ncbi:MAG: ParB N-terminal domain-containing protein [Peptostreptococcaceae bacterium]